MKFLWALALMASLLSAEKLIIDAKKFEAYDAKGFSLFKGDVKLRKGKDKLDSDELEVYMSKKSANTKREVLKYIATGNVSFEVVTLAKHYEGKGNKVIYNPKELKYTIIGNGYLKEKIEDKTLYGEEIYIDQATGEANVKGTSNKPVRFILNIEDKKTEKKPKEESKAEENKSEENSDVKSTQEVEKQ